jgi:hypothetical protein
MSYQALPGFVNDPPGSVTLVCILKFYAKINHFFGRICCNGKNKIKNKQSSIHAVEIVKMDDEELYMFLMMSWKNAASCLKSQNYVIRNNWKNLRVNENQ